mmetsp:Transcript_16918/g.51323  ORF Transcript_16918/g.51323 Transcript_16918/m.51323 type:complete len:95 (-) Transcript_16918:2228-2512(-)
MRAINSTTQINDEIDSIQVNFNQGMPPSKNKLNQGPSLCLAVGTYSGGELTIDEPDGRKMHNIHGKILRYNIHGNAGRNNQRNQWTNCPWHVHS